MLRFQWGPAAGCTARRLPQGRRARPQSFAGIRAIVRLAAWSADGSGPQGRTTGRCTAGCGPVPPASGSETIWGAQFRAGANAELGGCCWEITPRRPVSAATGIPRIRADRGSRPDQPSCGTPPRSDARSGSIGEERAWLGPSPSSTGRSQRESCISWSALGQCGRRAGAQGMGESKDVSRVLSAGRACRGDHLFWTAVTTASERTHLCRGRMFMGQPLSLGPCSQAGFSEASTFSICCWCAGLPHPCTLTLRGANPEADFGGGFLWHLSSRSPALGVYPGRPGHLGEPGLFPHRTQSTDPQGQCSTSDCDNLACFQPPDFRPGVPACFKRI